MARRAGLVERLSIAGAMTLAAATSALAVDYAERNIAARTEIMPISSQTVTDAQFLKGEAGTPVTLAGELRLPRGVTGKLPAVILYHPGGGLLTTNDIWSRHYLEQGFAVFMLDSLTGRGLVESAPGMSLTALVDLYAALDIVAAHPRVDPERILVQGFSFGGRAALYSAVERFDALWNHTGAHFAGHIAFYPNCGTAFLEDTKVRDVPIRIFGGEADNLASITACADYAARLTEAGGPADIEVTAYPGTPHGFGDPLLPPMIPLPNAVNTRDCVLVETSAGLVVNTATQQPFAPTDACATIGASLGGNRAAFDAARDSVLEFVGAFSAPQ